MKLLFTFIILNIVNVILQTAKSIATVKCDKTVAAIANAVAYGLYTVVIIYTVCDLPLWEKVLIVAISNFVGVYLVKFIETKLNKDKLWKIEATVEGLPYNYLEWSLKHYKATNYNIIKVNDSVNIVNFYCYTKEESGKAIQVCKVINAKFFVSESRINLHF